MREVDAYMYIEDHCSYRMVGREFDMPLINFAQKLASFAALRTWMLHSCALNFGCVFLMSCAAFSQMLPHTSKNAVVTCVFVNL